MVAANVVAIAVLPVPGCPPIKMALPAIFPYLINVNDNIMSFHFFCC